MGAHVWEDEVLTVVRSECQVHDMQAVRTKIEKVSWSWVPRSHDHRAKGSVCENLGSH